MIELPHVIAAIALVALIGFVGGLIIARIYFEKDVKKFWTNPRNSDDFLNVTPKTDNRKNHKSWEN